MARTPNQTRIPTKTPSKYPAPGGRTVPERARRQMYEDFRAHADEVREMLIAIVRDDAADNGHRIQAGKEILNRGYGMAPSIDIVEQVFKHQHSFDVDALRQLPPKELAALESVLAKLIQTDAEDAEVIEHKP